MNDRYRLCCSVFDALSNKGFLQNDNEHVHYARMYRDTFRNILVSTTEDVFVSRALPCWIDDDIKPQFYVLADGLLHGAVFVFFREIGEDDYYRRRTPVQTILIAHIERVGALINPTKNLPDGLIRT